MRSLIGRIVAGNYGIGWLFGAALVPAVLASAAFVYEIYRTERIQLEQAALQTSRALAHAVDRDISGIKGKLQVLATFPSLQTGDFRLFYHQAKQVLTTETLAEAIVLIDSTGQQVINTLRPFGSSLPKTGHPDMVQRTLESAQPSVSDLYVGGVARRYFLAVEVPVVREGKASYALDMGISPKRLSELLVSQRLPTDWVVALLDSKGIVIARSLNEAQFVGKSATPDILEQVREGNEGSFASHTLEGTPSFVAFSRSPYSGWIVVIGVNRAVLYRSLYGHLALAVLSVATFIFAGITLAWIFSRYIRDALHALEAATQAAAAGDFGVRAPTTGPREIARLAAQFNDMQTARKKAEEEIAALAHKDPLTNLPNRRLLLDRILQSLAHADRLHGCMAVCYLDLDGFKPVNDTYGHEAGDHVLVEVAHRLGQATRTHDTVARLGGDEFVLVLDDLKSREECDAIITRVLDIISEPISLQGGHLVKISASIGFTLYPGDSHDPETLLRHCDQAMYRAKGAGRNRVRFFDPRQDSSVA